MIAIISSSRMCKISNPKHQITNKAQIPISNYENIQVCYFEFWLLRFVWNLGFVIWDFHSAAHAELGRRVKHNTAKNITPNPSFAGQRLFGWEYKGRVDFYCILWKYHEASGDVDQGSAGNDRRIPGHRC